MRSLPSDSFGDRGHSMNDGHSSRRVALGQRQPRRAVGGTTGSAGAGRCAPAPPLPVDGRCAASYLGAPKGALAVEPDALAASIGTLSKRGPPGGPLLVWRPQCSRVGTRSRSGCGRWRGCSFGGPTRAPRMERSIPQPQNAPRGAPLDAPRVCLTGVRRLASLMCESWNRFVEWLVTSAEFLR